MGLIMRNKIPYSGGSSVSTVFTEAEQRENINSGETIPTILGKLSKWFTDFKTVAFSGSYNDLSDKPILDDATHRFVTDDQIAAWNAKPSADDLPEEEEENIDFSNF